MRICHVSPHLPPDQAANALLPAQLASWGSKHGHEVTTVSYEPSQGRSPVNADAGRVWRLARRSRTRGLKRLLRLDSVGHARQITAALKQAANRADVLHLHSNGLIIEVAASWARRNQLPYLLTLYGTEIWHYKQRRPIDPFERAYRAASVVTFYSHKLLDKSSELGLDRPNRVVVYPAISDSFAPQDDATRAEWRTALGIREPLMILNVKRLHELAGQQHLIEAFARIARRRRDVRLVICGTGPLRDALQTLASDRGVADRVTFAGLVANDEVARYSAVADVFALPSLLEALPTVAVEALASGTPVVSADHPGGMELSQIFGSDVQVVAKGNVDQLTDALSAALDARRRVEPGTLATVKALFGLQAITTAYENLYGAVAT